MAKYGKTASKKVEKTMHEMKEGKLKSGRSGKKVTNRKQAIAIGLSEAREAGAKVPTKKAAKKSPAKKKTAKKTATKKTTARKSPAKKKSPTRSKSAAKKKSPAKKKRK